MIYFLLRFVLVSIEYFKILLKLSKWSWVKLLPCDHEVMGSTVQVLEIAFYRNAEKDCVHKTQSS
jgi:hypothetical protein